MCFKNLKIIIDWLRIFCHNVLGHEGFYERENFIEFDY